MTQIDTDKLRALDEAATPGPWETDHEADEITRSHDYFVGAEVGGKWRTLMDTVNSDHKLIEDDRDGEGGMAWDVIGMANAELVAHLRNLVPAILAMAEDNRRLREALDWALNEIRCTTRYDNEGQFWNAYDIARQALAAPGDGG